MRSVKRKSIFGVEFGWKWNQSLWAGKTKPNQTIICVRLLVEQSAGRASDIPPSLLLATFQEKLNNRYVLFYGIWAFFIDLMFYVRKLLWHGTRILQFSPLAWRAKTISREGDEHKRRTDKRRMEEKFFHQADEAASWRRCTKKIKFCVSQRSATN